jgi:hypothetical protein
VEVAIQHFPERVDVAFPTAFEHHGGRSSASHNVDLVLLWNLVESILRLHHHGGTHSCLLVEVWDFNRSNLRSR